MYGEEVPTTCIHTYPLPPVHTQHRIPVPHARDALKTQSKCRGACYTYDPTAPRPCFHSDHNLCHTQKEGNGVLRATHDQEPCLPF